MTSYKGKKVLVSGGAGFIGSHIAEALAYQGAQVTVLDDLSTGNLENLKNILPAIELIRGDVRSFETCFSATKSIDTIFHLAAFISVPDSVKNPDLCFEINIRGTECMLEAAVKNKVKNFVFSSSAAVYGDRNDLCREQDPTDPKSPYAKSKIEGELLCRDYARVYDISTASLRYFNVYGDRQNPDSEYAAVVAKFTNMLKTKQPLTVFGTGAQTRDFIEVSEIVKANLVMGTQPEMEGEIFNIATGNSIKVLDLIDKVKDQLKIQPVGINFMPARAGDIQHSKADCNKYKNFVAKMSKMPLHGIKTLSELS